MKKRSWQKPSIQRLIFLFIALILQVGWLYIILFNISSYSWVAEVVSFVISVVMIAYLFMKDENPAYRQSWLCLILLFPLLGGILYFLVGNKRPAKDMHHKILAEEAKHKHELKLVPTVNHLLTEQDPHLGGISRYLNEYADATLSLDNDVRYYPHGQKVMNDLIVDLKNAKKSIFIEFFIVDYGVMFDTIFEVLAQKAKEGVDVRFLYDGLGTITRLPTEFPDYCASIGVKAMVFNPIRPILSMVYNTRDHRKFVIIDSEIAYTGGLNLADEYINVVERFGDWKDTMIRVEGPGVWSYSVMFLNMWNAFMPTDQSYDEFRPSTWLEDVPTELATMPEELARHGFIQPFGDTPLDNEPVGENVYRAILDNATDYVYIYTPYLVISHEMQVSLEMAAKRGVTVKLFLPGIPDKKIVYRMTRSFYPPLLKAGVEIYEYSPGFLHAKSFVSDDKIATVGTSNLDYRSLYLHFETNTVLYYHPIIEQIRDDMLQTEQVSRRVQMSDTRQTIFGNMIDAFLRTLAPFA